MKKKYSVLSKAIKVNLQLNPYPHLVIEDALPQEYYNILSSKFPLNYFENNKIEGENNVRKDIFYKDLMTNNEIDPEWKNFISYHSSMEFYHEILSVFEDIILQKFPNIFKNKNYLYDLGTSNQLSTSINTPVIKNTSARGAHLDNLNKLFTGLFYMRSEKDNSQGGDLELFSWKKKISINKKRLSSRFGISMSDIQLIKTIKYKPNTFVIFLNSLDSLHGVTPRSVTNEYRKMCVFTSKLPFVIDKLSLLDRFCLKALESFSR